ncbi:putative DnaJ domain, Chaperone J-domain superfamily [Helianthus debilis subsp. tardiflorus]
MSLTINFVLQKSDLTLNKLARAPINGVKTTSVISCKAKELQIHNKKNLYQVLSVESHNDSLHELKKAYRAKALRLHPDACPSSKKEECTKQFVELREAYEVLSDPQSRRMYDLSLVGDHASSEQKVHFARTVWETQLDALKQRSATRPKRRNICFV